MASRLTDLLERIRPAGTPGAPSDLISRREQAVTDELAELATALARLDDEADAVVAEARSLATRVRAEAEREAGQIRSDLPDRVAVAESSGLGSSTPDDDPEAARVIRESDREIAELRERAVSLLPDLVDRAVAVVWDLLAEPEAEREAAS